MTLPRPPSKYTFIIGGFKMKYGYARVSSAGQALENQIAALEKEECHKIYAEYFTGTITNRPKFNKLLEDFREDDTLVVTKLDRFARSANQGSELVKDLLMKGVKVHILNIGLQDNTPAS